MPKQDHEKLAKRHIDHLSAEQLRTMQSYVTSRLSTLLVLAYTDKKILEGFMAVKYLPKVTGKFITFKRFKKL